MRQHTTCIYKAVDGGCTEWGMHSWLICDTGEKKYIRNIHVYYSQTCIKWSVVKVPKITSLNYFPHFVYSKELSLFWVKS